MTQSPRRCTGLTVLPDRVSYNAGGAGGSCEPSGGASGTDKFSELVLKKFLVNCSLSIQDVDGRFAVVPDGELAEVRKGIGKNVLL